MSLLSRNQLWVLISNQALSIQQHGGKFRSRVVHQQHIHFTQSDEYPWRDATQSLDTVLATLKLPARSQLKITLASECVRYLTLPASFMVARSSEKNAYAQAFYHEVYGDRINDWVIQQDDAPPHLPALSVAMDKLLLENIKQIAEKYDLKLFTVEPYVMTVVNCFKKEIGRTNGYLAIIEDHRLILLQLQKGRVVHLKSDAIHHEWQTSLHNMLLRETLLSEDVSALKGAQIEASTQANLLVYAPNIKGQHPPHIADFPVKMLSQQNNTHPETSFAMMAALA